MFDPEERHIPGKPFIYGKGKLDIARDVNLVDALINLACGNVTIGRGTFFGHRVMVLTGSHNLHDKTRSRSAFDRHIVIGRDVWLASGCIILGPCTIGDRAVVAAGAVVPPGSKLEAGWVYMGVPAKKERRAEKDAPFFLLTDQRKKRRL